MIISVLITAKGRTENLRKTFPSFIGAANESPPIEFVVVNYDSPDDMDEYFQEAKNLVSPENFITYIKVENKPYWHMAHSRNIAIKRAHGDFVFFTSAESGMKRDYFFSYIRKRIDVGVRFFKSSLSGGLIICDRKELIEAGGMDERFEYYGCEDAELLSRLHRRGLGKYEIYSQNNFIWTLDNRETDKSRFVYYRPINGVIPTKSEMRKVTTELLYENNKNNILVVNENIEWGKEDI